MKILNLNCQILEELLPSFSLTKALKNDILSYINIIKQEDNRKGIYYFQVAIIEGSVCGYGLTFYNSDTSCSSLAKIYVHQKYRKKGIAKKIIDSSLWIADIHGANQHFVTLAYSSDEHYGLHRYFQMLDSNEEVIDLGWVFDGKYFGKAYSG